MREKHEKKNCHAIFNPSKAGQVPSKAPDYTGTSRTSYVEDVSLLCLSRFSLSLNVVFTIPS
jgi:hypothetical protein